MKDKGITLIALVLTIIVLIILAGVTVATLTGENGIIQKANEAREKMKMAEAEETINLILLSCQTEYAINKNMDLPAFVTKENNEVEVEQDNGIATGNIGTGEPLSYWLMTYKGYIFEINNLQIEGSRKAELGPIAVVKVDETYKFASKVGSNNVIVEMDITLPTELAGATISVAQSTEVDSEGTGTITGSYDAYDATTGKYTGTVEADGTVSSNGKYVYEIKATKNGKDYSINRVVNIKNFLDNPKIEVPEENKKMDELTIKVTNNYPGDASVQYKYYIARKEENYPIVENLTPATEVIKTQLTEGTEYKIKVEAYLKNENGDAMVETEIQATTEDRYIEVRTIEDLEAMNNDLTNKYKLMNNLDFKQRSSYATDEKYDYYNQDDNGDGNPDNSWVPLGTFSGKFNGNYHIIKNLFIRSSDSIGFFASANGASFSHLILEQIDVGSASYYNGAKTGGLVGIARTCSFEEVGVYGKVGNVTSWEIYSGLIVGSSEYSTYNRCFGNGTIDSYTIHNAKYGTGGSIIGNMSASDSINDSYGCGGPCQRGLIAGFGKIKNCYSIAIATHGLNDSSNDVSASFWNQEDSQSTATSKRRRKNKARNANKVNIYK